MKKTRCNVTRALTALAFAAIGAGAWAAPPWAQAPECSLNGTWAGSAGSDMQWMAIHTPGSTASKGEMLMNWLFVDEGLSAGYKMTPGTGVFEQTGAKTYAYTWYSYLSEGQGAMPLFAVRVRGIATLSEDCNTASIQYRFEYFPADFSAVLGTINGTA